MGSASTSWVSPHLCSHGAWTATVWVLNPNASAATVTVTFYEQWGPIVDQSTKVINASETLWFHTQEHGNMWVLIESDQPVLPAGHTPIALYHPDKYVDLTFYDATGMKPEDIVRIKRSSLPRDVEPQSPPEPPH